MRTQEQIYNELLSKPENAAMTKMVNGITVPISDDERIQILEKWAADTYEQQSKKWRNVEAFMAEFTLPEKAAIALSTDPTIVALRFELTTWMSLVYANDSRVLAGLDRLIEIGIITPERKDSIITA